METLRFAISLVLGMALPYAVIRVDRARLEGAQRAYAWNTATMGSALYAFGPLALLGWFVVTRWPTMRSASLGERVLEVIARILLALLVAVVIFLVILGVDAGIDALVGASK